MQSKPQQASDPFKNTGFRPGENGEKLAFRFSSERIKPEVFRDV
jgi:hypothetical protein